MRLSGVLLLLTLPLIVRAGDSKLTLCLDPQADVPVDVMMIASLELRHYTSILKTRVELDCTERDALRVTLESRPSPAMPSDVLAAVPTRNGRILPGIRVFYDSVREMLPDRSPVLLARALALVIVHECYHYLNQDSGHAAQGVRAQAFTGEDLERGAQWWAQHASLETAAGQ